jgi:CTP:molybdopterin cytidylyltransferase MocA
MMLNVRYDVLVAAGGLANRFSAPPLSANKPKSLLFGATKPVVLSTVEYALLAGYRRILVLNNRPEWHDELKKALASVSQADVVQDPGYASTFMLAKTFAQQLDSRFLFLYGHAPRPAEHLVLMSNVQKKIVASAFSNSTKSKVVRYGQLFLEPPYLIDRQLVEASQARDWVGFFEGVAGYVGIYESDAPAEPNTRGEFDDYLAHYALTL